MAKYILSDIFEGSYPVTQKFGERPEYYGQFTIFGVKQKGHEGVDWGTPTGTTVFAPFDGVVLRQDFQSDFKNYGKVVVIWDPVQKCAIWHCHLATEYVVNGQTVKRGQVVGKTGATGNVQGAHLHFGLVETDRYGNRLHYTDGWGGFVDPLNPAIVEWKLAGQQPPLTNDQLVEKTKEILRSGDNAFDKEYKLKQLYRL